MIKDSGAPQVTGNQRRLVRLAIATVLLAGSLARIGVLFWSDPWSPHQPDEHILPLEAMALWEGVTPREVGWPGSTTRIVLSGVQAIQWAGERGLDAWRLRSAPNQALETVTTWIGQRYVDPTPLYRLGRALSVFTGILELCATVWALSQWVGPVGVLLGTAMVAFSPVIVAYSQYVLADVMGLLFATILIGLAAKPTPRRVVAMGALAGLAASSKFHFGMWVVTPLLAIWLDHDLDRRRKWWLSFLTVGAAVWVTLTFVPWFLINPLLALKEFAGVVLVKIGHGPRLIRMPSNLRVLFGSLGPLAWVGLLTAIVSVFWRRSRRLATIWIPAVIGTIVVSESGTVFDRYVLPVVPGAVLLASWGWEQWLTDSRRWIQRPALLAAVAVTIATGVGLVAAQRRDGEADVDVLVQHWVLANVERGRRIAIHDENNVTFPRTAEELRTCAAYDDGPAAWREKWLVEGVETGTNPVMPMQSVVLTDEHFRAYWCRRELEVQKDAGYWIVPYNSNRRFGAVLERDAISEFRTGSRALTGGVDVLVTNRPVDVGRPPVQELRTERGQRIIYTR